MKRTEYHEVYGWMPDDIVNELSQMDRNRMFIEYIQREPTPAGRLIVTAAVKELGEPFLDYVFKATVEALESDGEEYTKDDLIGYVNDLFNSFATDLNIFLGYVDTYLEEFPESLKIESVSSTTPQPRDPKTGRFMKK
jgi:hypothetical protein